VAKTIIDQGGQTMSDFIRLSGPWGIILTAIIFLNLGLAIWSLVPLLSSHGKIGPALGNRINAILFWGATGAVLGVLGQATGIYLALQAISRAPEISPPVVLEGFSISFLTTIVGFILFLFSGLVWMGLRTMHNRRLSAEMAI
jgi:hypothetical protein